jgi:hypothetical protein
LQDAEDLTAEEKTMFEALFPAGAIDHLAAF